MKERGRGRRREKREWKKKSNAEFNLPSEGNKFQRNSTTSSVVKEELVNSKAKIKFPLRVVQSDRLCTLRKVQLSHRRVVLGVVLRK